MKSKIILVMAAAVVAIGCIIVAALLTSSPADKAPPEKAGGGTVSTPATTVAVAAPQVPAPEVTPPPVNSPKLASPAAKPADTAPADAPLVINGYEVQDPMARVALSFVGSDPDADTYWVGAINDPSLPPEERKDLIEDLNEDGLSDPQHPGPEDMPLILSRLRLLEQLAANAMDDVNRDAFKEAYKDLAGMAKGEPPQ
jgi:hypothetical protein